MHSYSNPSSQESDGDDCDILCILEACGCDNQFTFCLRPHLGSRSTDKTFCPLGGFQRTSVFSNSDIMSFDGILSLGASVSNPVLYAGDSWPVSYIMVNFSNAALSVLVVTHRE